MKIYLLVGAEQRGPYSLETVITMISAGEVTLETLFWEEGMPEWQALGKRSNLRPAPVTIAPPRRTQTGTPSTGDFKDTFHKKEVLSSRRKPITIAKALMALILFFVVLSLAIEFFGRSLPDTSKQFEDLTGHITSQK